MTLKISNTGLHGTAHFWWCIQSGADTKRSKGGSGGEFSRDGWSEMITKYQLKRGEVLFKRPITTNKSKSSTQEYIR